MCWRLNTVLYGCEFSSFDIFSRELTAFEGLFTVLDIERTPQGSRERGTVTGSGHPSHRLKEHLSAVALATFPPAFIHGHAAGKLSSLHLHSTLRWDLWLSVTSINNIYCGLISVKSDGQFFFSFIFYSVAVWQWHSTLRKHSDGWTLRVNVRPSRHSKEHAPPSKPLSLTGPEQPHLGPCCGNA